MTINDNGAREGPDLGSGVLMALYTETEPFKLFDVN